MRLINFNTHPSLWTLTLVGFVPRSPWSNEYDPPLDDGTVPSVKLRKLEIAANEAFDTYREMYASFASDSTWFPLKPDTLASYLSFPGTTKAGSHRYTSGTWTMAGSPGWFCLRRVSPAELHPQVVRFLTLDIVLTPAKPTESAGSWDSIHVFEASERGRQAHYKLTSTIMLNMVNNNEKQAGEGGKKTSDEIGLSGSMTRQVSDNLSRLLPRPQFRRWLPPGR